MNASLKIILSVTLLLVFFMVGILFGITIGTYAVIEKTAYALSGSTFIVNLNETKLINEMNKTIVPTMLKELKTAQEIFFLNETATTKIYTLSLRDLLPI